MGSLQFVLRITNRICDTKYNIYCSLAQQRTASCTYLLHSKYLLASKGRVQDPNNSKIGTIQLIESKVLWTQGLYTEVCVQGVKHALALVWHHPHVKSWHFLLKKNNSPSLRNQSSRWGWILSLKRNVHLRGILCPKFL